MRVLLFTVATTTNLLQQQTIQSQTYTTTTNYTIMKLLQQQQRTIQLQILYDKLIRMLQLIIYRESDKVEGSIRDLVIFEVETVIT